MRYRRKLKIHKKYWLYILLSASLVIGICFGAVFANQMDSTQKGELLTYMDQFFTQFNMEPMNQTAALTNSMFNYGRTMAIIWIAGITIIGLPFVCIVLGYKGFTYGFTAAFLIKQYGWNGVIFSFLSYLPQNLILLPTMIYIANISMQFAISNFQNRRNKTKHVRERRQELLEYGLVLVIGMAVIALVSMMETYITPQLIKSVLPQMMQ